MSSISVRFNSFLFLYSIFNEHKAPCSSFRKASCSRHCRVVGLDGLEPSTSRLSGVRSNHLSYKPFSSHSFGIGSRHHVLANSVLVERLSFFTIGVEVPRLRGTSPRLGVGTADWWRWWGSNPWPPACRAGALPAELHPRFRVAFAFSKIFKLSLVLISENWTTKVPY